MKGVSFLNAWTDNVSHKGFHLALNAKARPHILSRQRGCSSGLVTPAYQCNEVY
jgi:hypothetical protein